MWAAISALGHFLSHDVHREVWMHIAVESRVNPFGGRVETLTSLIGCAILSALNALDRLDELKEDSAFRDLGLVMAMYLQFSLQAIDGTTHWNQGDEVDWQLAVIQYAANAGIKLTDQGVAGLEDIVKVYKRVPISGKVTASRWKWAESVSRDICTDFRQHLANDARSACILPNDIR